MPNWCHNVLTVSGDEEAVERFVAAARPSEETLRRSYDAVAAERLPGDQLPPFEEWAEEQSRTTPLTFQRHVPEPSPVDLLLLEKRRPCVHCDATGRRPRADVLRFMEGDEEAADRWYTQTGGCNACHGDGVEVVHPGWLEFRTANWGTKWDASFGGPFVAVSASDDIDVEASTDANGLFRVEGTAVYRFDTAWSPPDLWLARAANAHPDVRLDLRWGEPGSEAAGIFVYADGALVEERELELGDVLSHHQMWF